MTDDRLGALLRTALPPQGVRRSTRDLWPAIEDRIHARIEWSLVDLCVAAGVLAGLAAMFTLAPEALLLLAYHL